MLHIDFESRSRINLLTDGGYNYAMDESTQVTMMAFVFGNDDEPELWIPRSGLFWDSLREALILEKIPVHSVFPHSITMYIEDGKDIAAHNAQFERLNMWYGICPDHDIPEPTIDQFYCTATQARVNNLPATLKNCARALGVSEQKDSRGTELIKLLCVPDEHGNFLEDLDLYVEFAKYCMQDVRAERDISNAMRPLTPEERDDYFISETINDVGIKVDLDVARHAVEYADAEQADLIGHITKYTVGEVTKARGKNMLQWVYSRLEEAQQAHMHVYKNGEQKRTLDRSARERLLSDPETPVLVRKVVEFADFAQASSTAKFNNMIRRADPEDHRVRGAYVHAGAGSTHRYTSRGLQMHNLPRDGLDKEQKGDGYLKTPISDNVVNAMRGHAEPSSIASISGHGIMQTLKRLLRYSIISEVGKTFVCGDWAAIEGRALPWLAMGINGRCDAMAQVKLDQFINSTGDYDVYCRAAEAIYGFDVRKDNATERQVGKVAELSLGFGGGVGAFKGMAVNYGVHVNNAEADRIKTAWRAANPWAPIFWKALHTAAIRAVNKPNTQQTAGRVSYCFQPSGTDGTLWCLLPSGNVLSYPGARVEMVEGLYGTEYRLSAMKASWTPKKDDTEWPRITMWHGVLAENVTQAVCAVLLRDLLLDLIEHLKAPVVGHTHDEALLEVDIADADYWCKQLNAAMVRGSDWSEGLPLAAEIWTGPRYRK